MSNIKSLAQRVKTKLGAKESLDRGSEPDSGTGETEKKRSSDDTEDERNEIEIKSADTETDVTRELSRDLGIRFGYSLSSYSSVLMRWENKKPRVSDGGRGKESPDILECVFRKGKWRVSYTVGPDSWCIDSTDDRREALKTVCWVMENGIDENVREMRENHSATAVSGS
jgi:hypothetical protein